MNNFQSVIGQLYQLSNEISAQNIREVNKIIEYLNQTQIRVQKKFGDQSRGEDIVRLIESAKIELRYLIGESDNFNRESVRIINKIQNT